MGWPGERAGGPRARALRRTPRCRPAAACARCRGLLVPPRAAPPRAHPSALLVARSRRRLPVLARGVQPLVARRDGHV